MPGQGGIRNSGGELFGGLGECFGGAGDAGEPFCGPRVSDGGNSTYEAVNASRRPANDGDSSFCH